MSDKKDVILSLEMGTDLVDKLHSLGIEDLGIELRVGRVPPIRVVTVPDGDASAFTDVKCTRCGCKRLACSMGAPTACSGVECPDPLHDVMREQMWLDVMAENEMKAHDQGERESLAAAIKILQGLMQDARDEAERVQDAHGTLDASHIHAEAYYGGVSAALGRVAQLLESKQSKAEVPDEPQK